METVAALPLWPKASRTRENDNSSAVPQLGLKAATASQYYYSTVLVPQTEIPPLLLRKRLWRQPLNFGILVFFFPNGCQDELSYSSQTSCLLLMVLVAQWQARLNIKHD